MKPEEFDKLLRQKFDCNDFDYNENNWEKMEMRLNDSHKSRNVAFWWMPIIAIAAAVTISMGFASYMSRTVPVNTTKEVVKTSTKQIIIDNTISSTKEKFTNPVAINNMYKNKKNTHNKIQDKIYIETSNYFGINITDAIENMVTTSKSTFKKTDTKIIINLLEMQPKNEKKKVANNIQTNNSYKAIIEKENKKEPIACVNILCGINYGGHNSGFMIGATGRRMVNDHVFVEGDIALTSTGNTQKTASAIIIDNNSYQSSTSNSGARTTGDVSIPSDQPKIQEIIKTFNQSFSTYYAQITPTLGYKLTKKIAIGAGPDFQQALNDNRPLPSILDRDNVQVIPMFDIGFITKTELALNKNIKVAVFYREGINNILTPMNKYLERSYFQFQLKYSIINKTK